MWTRARGHSGETAGNPSNASPAVCHKPTLQTGTSTFGPALSNQTIHPYSDYALHHMGPGLADGITQGLALGDEFRTAPLWGLGQRLFFLQDGRWNALSPSDKEALLSSCGRFEASCRR